MSIYMKGLRIGLRLVDVADANILCRWFNDSEITAFLPKQLPTTQTKEEEWIRKTLDSETDYVFCIVDLELNTSIGIACLHRIDWMQRTVHSVTVLGEKEYWGKGYATEAKQLIHTFAFAQLDLYAIQARISSENQKSLTHSIRNGYIEVGRISNWIRKTDDTRCDEVLLLFTKDMWHKSNQQKDLG